LIFVAVVETDGIVLVAAIHILAISATVHRVFCTYSLCCRLTYSCSNPQPLPGMAGVSETSFVTVGEIEEGHPRFERVSNGSEPPEFLANQT